MWSWTGKITKVGLETDVDGIFLRGGRVLAQWIAVLGSPFDAGVPATWFRDEWKSPSNYAFTILLLLGGDVVTRALAQLVGSRFTPVAFSFGMILLYSGEAGDPQNR